MYYLELRTTPRIVKGSKSIQAYTDAVLKAIEYIYFDSLVHLYFLESITNELCAFINLS